MTKRAQPQIGDVFAVRGTKLLGRVVSTTAIVGPTHGCALVYVYRDAERLSREALLAPPMLTTRAPWSHGYFELVRSAPLLAGDRFARHSFREDSTGHLYDEESRPLKRAIGPVGVWRLLDVAAIGEVLART